MDKGPWTFRFVGDGAWTAYIEAGEIRMRPPKPIGEYTISVQGPAAYLAIEEIEATHTLPGAVEASEA